MKKAAFKIIALLSTGLLAGAFFYASLNVVPTFSEVKPAVHLSFRTALMQHNGISMPIIMLLATITPSLYAFTVNKHEKIIRTFAFMATVLALASFLTTFFGNVPINGIIKTWVPDAPPDNWQALLKRWNFFHSIRTMTAIGSFVCMILSGQLQRDISPAITSRQ